MSEIDRIEEQLQSILTRARRETDAVTLLPVGLADDPALLRAESQVWREALAGVLTVPTIRALREAVEARSRGAGEAPPGEASQPRRRGRPKAGAEERRRGLSLALSSIEAAVLEAAAKDAGTTPVELVRQALFRAPLPGPMTPLADTRVEAALAACEGGLVAGPEASAIEPHLGELEQAIRGLVPGQRQRIAERLDGRRGAVLKVAPKVLATKVREDLRPVSEFQRRGLQYRPEPKLVADEERRGHPNPRRRARDGSVRLGGTTLRVRLMQDELQLLRVVSSVLEASPAVLARQVLFGAGLPPSRVPETDDQLLNRLARLGADLRSQARSHPMGSDEHAAYYRLALRSDELRLQLERLYRHQRRTEAAAERQARARSRAMWAVILGGGRPR